MSAPLRVGLDYHAGATHFPGVGRYARELARALAELLRAGDPDVEGLDLRLFDVGRAARVVPEAALGLAGAPLARRRLALPRRLLPLLARVGPGADRLLGGVDVFHHVLPDPPPVRRARQVLALSDPPAPGGPAARRLAGAARALVFSAHAAAELERGLGLDPARVFEVPVGCEHFRRALPDPPPPLDPPVVLVLGALAARRSPLALVAALEELRRGGLDVRLRWIGRRGDAAAAFEAAVARSKARGAVTWQADPVDAELPLALAEASCLVHLNAAEGTPVTPLEALSFGRPALVSDLPAFRQALGDEAHYVPAPEPAPRALAERLAAALDGARDAAASAARTRRAAAYTWERNARATVAVWRAVHAAPPARDEPGTRPANGAGPR